MNSEDHDGDNDVSSPFPESVDVIDVQNDELRQITPALIKYFHLCGSTRSLSSFPTSEFEDTSRSETQHALLAGSKFQMFVHVY